MIFSAYVPIWQKIRQQPPTPRPICGVGTIVDKTSAEAASLIENETRKHTPF